MQRPDHLEYRGERPSRWMTPSRPVMNETILDLLKENATSIISGWSLVWAIILMIYYANHF